MDKELELRMYFFTIYQLTGIQAGIQCGHAALEYAYKYFNSDKYRNFYHKWKTWVILNGGTTNSKCDLNGIREGTLDRILQQLCENNISHSYFCEPDLNDALTAVCFICDERVFNKELYPDYREWSEREWSEFEWDDSYNRWVNFIGGEKNVFLRELLNGKKLAG